MHAGHREASSHDLIRRKNDHERVLIDEIRDELDLADLRERADEEEYVALFARKRALPMQKCHAAPDLADDRLRNRLHMVGDDEHDLAAVEARDDPIRHGRIHEHADERVERGHNAEERGGQEHDDAVESENHAAHIQRIILLHDGGDDVEAARTAVHAEDDAIADTVQHAAEDRCEHRIRHGRIGIQEARCIDAEGKENRAKGDVERVLAPKRLVRRREKRQIVEKHLHADGKREEIVEDHRNARNAARQEVRRHDEEVDRRTADQAAEQDAEIAENTALQGQTLDVKHQGAPFSRPSQRSVGV